MLKHISTYFALLLLMLAGCSAEDLPWEGQLNTEEDIAVAFHTRAFAQVDATTRSSATEPTTATISNLHLVVFDSDGGFYYDKAYTPSDFFTGSEDTDAVKVKRTAVCPGTWYLVANGETPLKTFLDGANKSETQFNSTVLTQALVFDSSKPAIMTAKQTVNALPAANAPVLTAFNLERNYAKITLQVSDDCKQFDVNATRLVAEDTEVSITGQPLMKMVTKSNTDFVTKANGATTYEFFVLPVANKMAESVSTYPEARLLIRGKFAKTIDPDTEEVTEWESVDTYYAYKFPSSIKANHNYVLTLKAVEGRGTENDDEAAANPVGAVIYYEDKYDEIKNIATDGERAIAVPDTVKIDADATTRVMTVSWRGRATDQLQLPASLPAWISDIQITNDTSQTQTDEESSKGVTRHETEVTLTIAQNKGTERMVTLPFQLKDVDALVPEVVIYQHPAEITLDQFLDIKLSIKRGSATELDEADYLVFISNKEGTGTKTYGITPVANGGKVRNTGLHAPMPNNDGTTPVEYVYTITTPSGWTLAKKPDGLTATQSGNTWTISFKDNSYSLGSKGAAAYEIFEDGIVFENADTTITLDVYHTGFFHKRGSNWYYYEVFSAGGQRWLDRNICATATGMAHLTDVMLTGTWPINAGSQGSYETLADAKNRTATLCPPGWHMPSQGDFEKLAMQQNFSSDRLSMGGSTIFVPSYRFTATIYKDGRQSTQTVNSYFPHNRYSHRTEGISGDEGAGYYLTSTATDNKAYYRVMKFVGMNVTAETLNFGDALTERSLSLRCVAGESVDDETYTYSCQVKGYTHVFLYHVAKDGTKTYLNTWPGTEVGIGDMVTKRYNPFSYTSYVDLEADGGKVFVIFNNVTASGTTSNVNSTAVKNRQGIPFVKGGAYASNATPKLTYTPTGGSANIVTSGNWIDGDNVVEARISVTLMLLNEDNWVEGCGYVRIFGKGGNDVTAEQQDYQLLMTEVKYDGKKYYKLTISEPAYMEVLNDGGRVQFGTSSSPVSANSLTFTKSTQKFEEVSSKRGDKAFFFTNKNAGTVSGGSFTSSQENDALATTDSWAIVMKDYQLKWTYNKNNTQAPKIRIESLPEGCTLPDGTAITNGSIYESEPIDNGDNRAFKFKVPEDKGNSSNKIKFSLLRQDNTSRVSNIEKDLGNVYIDYYDQ